MRRLALVLALLATLALLAAPAALADVPPVPKLYKFKANGRIATGKVARYDLKQESMNFSYRLRGEYVVARVQKRRNGKWVYIGRARTAPPRPIDFWKVFKKMGLGRYRIVARAYNGKGAGRQHSAAKIIRFRVVRHDGHQD